MKPPESRVDPDSLPRSMRTTARRLAVGVAAALIGLCTAAASAAEDEAIPIAEGRNCTERDFWADVVKAHRYMETEGYKRHGRRDPKWDKRAIDLLDESAKMFTASDAPAAYAPTHLGARWVMQEAEEIVKMGCNDPMVLYAFATSAYGCGRKDEGLRTLREAAEKLEVSEYHPMRKCLGWAWCSEWMPDDPDRAHFQERAEYWRNQAYFMKDDGPSALKRWMARTWSSKKSEWWEPRIRALEKMEDPDPWARDLALGLYNKCLAWDARGSGWSSTVTDAGWRLFGEHLRTAARHLIAAHRVHPDRPEAATEMIAIAMAGEDRTLSMREWFDRAVAAQFDYMPAYDSYEWALRPRWGGSHKAMYRFGVECLRTGRFETDVPREFMSILYAIDGERENNGSAFRQSGVFENGMKMYEGLIATPERAHQVEFWQVRRAGFAWRCQRYSAARGMLDEMQDATKALVSKNETSGAEDPVEQTYGLTSPAGPDILKADKLYKTRQYEPAAEAYRAAEPKVGDNPYARAYLANRIRRAEWMEEFARAGEVALTPAKDLAGWRRLGGDWYVDDKGWIVGASNKDGLLLLTDLDAGADWELSGVVSAGETQDVASPNAAIIPFGIDEHRFWTFTFYPRKDSVWYLYGYGNGRKAALPFSPRYNFRVMRWQDHAALEVDGKILHSIEMPESATGKRLFGLGGSYANNPGYMVGFGELKLRRLTEEPGWAAESEQED